MAAKVEPFWKRKTLAQLDQDEWSRCVTVAACAACRSFEDEDDGSVYYTRIACKLLDLQSCRCNYAERIRFVPDCIQLTRRRPTSSSGCRRPAAIAWLPKAGPAALAPPGLRRPGAGPKERISQSGRMLSETGGRDDWEDYLIFRAG